VGDDEDDQPTIKLVALKSIRRQEVEIAQVLEGVRQLDDLPSPRPDWRTLLTGSTGQGGFGEPKTQRESDAIDEKVRSLETLFGQRISFLTGGAGTGKTSVLKVFLRKLREVEGVNATLLAAPTGKARVRLQAATERPSNTIHQILDDVEMLGPNYRILDKPEKGQLSFTNIVIDESSMPSVELFAALFRAVKVNAFRRLIFVGDQSSCRQSGRGGRLSMPFDGCERSIPSALPSCGHACVSRRRIAVGLASARDWNSPLGTGMTRDLAMMPCSPSWCRREKSQMSRSHSGMTTPNFSQLSIMFWRRTSASAGTTVRPLTGPSASKRETGRLAKTGRFSRQLVFSLLEQTNSIASFKAASERICWPRRVIRILDGRLQWAIRRSSSTTRSCKRPIDPSGCRRAPWACATLQTGRSES
jgi:hypothetical protein